MARAGAALIAVVALVGCQDFIAPGPGARRDAAPDSALDGGAPGSCVAHEDCPSTICDQFGVVIGTAGQCLPQAQTVVVGTAAELASAIQKRQGIRLLPGLYQGSWVLQQNLVLVGPAAKQLAGNVTPAVLQPVAAGAVVHVSAQATLDGLEIQGGTGSSGHGVLCDQPSGQLQLRRVQISQNSGLGVWAQCPLTVDQALIGITSVLAGNLAGGIMAQSSLRLTNSFIVGNGTGANDMGALTLAPPSPMPPSAMLLAHLTLAANIINIQDPLINCATDGPVPLWGSLLWANAGAGDGEQIIGGCTLAAVASDGQGDLPAGSVHLGQSNSPDFVSEADFHIQGDSPVIDVAPIEGPDLPYDIDGNPRPHFKLPDFGGHEYSGDLTAAAGPGPAR